MAGQQVEALAPESGFVRELSGLNVGEVQAYLASHCHQPFEQSELYVAAEEKNVVDTTRRLSTFRKIADVGLFDLLEPFVAQLGEKDPLLSYAVVRNDVTHIKYEKGGFFRKHTDYVSVSSNLLEEFSMLVCITPEELAVANQGGKTVVHLHHRSHVSDATTTPGCALAFRKDLEHEGLVLEAGEKHILMLNLWATRKEEGGVLLVHFGAGAEGVGSQQATPSLHQLARDRSYAISVTEARRSCKLADNIRSHEASGTAAVLQYECKDCSYNAFGVIFRILRRLYVSAQEVEEHAELIKLYGLDAHHILVTTQEDTHEGGGAESSEGHDVKKMETQGMEHTIRIYMMDGSAHSLKISPSDTVQHLKSELRARAGLRGMSLFKPGSDQPLRDAETIADLGLPTELFTVKRMTKVDEYQVLGLTDGELADITEPVEDPIAVEDEGSDVIVCESLERTAVVARAAIDAGLPFVSFQVLLIEGELSVSGDTGRPCRHGFHMDPAFISLGDCKQVFGWGVIDSDWDGDCRWWEHDVGSRAWPSNPVLLDLQRALKPETGITEVMRSVFGMTHRSYFGSDSDDDGDSDSNDDGERQLVMDLSAPSDFEAGTDDDQSLFHVNADGQTCFDAREAAAASARLREILFVDQLKDRVSKVPWQFPQDSSANRDHLCNESIYGHANIVLVSGVVRLSADKEASEARKQEEQHRLRLRYLADTP